MINSVDLTVAAIAKQYLPGRVLCRFSPGPGADRKAA
ncbi:hypothetical protein BJQ89_01378 [Arthrobacter sp. ES1]|nr:hypothetical protein [Arthrobacter sp. ES1]